ncbi:ornithine cyclodeaminase family protein [Micromonospora peucetia]|uniref:Ornithine cyclodeaminase n=1 Tax=Micromonospora peucetia TaxID=47871 RepID=A0A1C6U3M3_9ACTN|nr:ornithine cyclodeaminase family protein [Micromonospora peucetia]MCX4386021.1 ornithine cyclodeaminase family protein [Micromonospora peucetia]WSA33387.1 ornithine cyclodeaminase family protein [Micromonospora peucetia]SCL48670.1 ornithine cyclodeaminase [Micromonospora peucetia]
MPLFFSDPEVAAALDAPATVAAMREALLAAYAGRLVAPPRAAAPLGGGRMVLTAGHLTGEWYGFRSYDTFGHPESAQVVVLHDGRTGAVRAVAVGEELGSRRTGGLGGVAVDALARPDAATLGVIGSGGQAWTQVWAAAAVRPLREVTVHSRSAARREAFAARVRAELGVPARAVDSARAAVRDRDVVVLATTAVTPVLDAADLAPGTHVNTVGFKQVDRHEFGADLLDAADLLATDSPAQAAAYDPPMLATLPGYAGRLRDLGAVLAGAVPGRTGADQVTVFCSTGLAGTEVFLLDRLVRVGAAVV